MPLTSADSDFIRSRTVNKRTSSDSMSLVGRTLTERRDGTRSLCGYEITLREKSVTEVPPSELGV